MKTMLWYASLRYLGRHPWQMGLSVLGIALGVAVVVAVELANESAHKAFDLSMQAVTGKATHQIIGGPTGLEESFYVRLRREGIAPVSAPVVSGYVTLACISHNPPAASADPSDLTGRSPSSRLDVASTTPSPSSGPSTLSNQHLDTLATNGGEKCRLGDQTFQLLGIDPFAERRFRNFLSYMPDGEEDVALRKLLTQPGAVLMSRDQVASLGLQVGKTVELVVSGQIRQGLIVGTFDPPPQRKTAMRDLLVADIATAQELLGRLGRLSRIDLILPDKEKALVATIKALLPPEARLVPAAARGIALQEMTRAFAINLTAMSLLALLVGMFLIYNTMSFSVLQRRELMGSLRVLGATRQDIFILVLAEGLLIGGVGTVLGLLLGTLLAQELVQLVTRTINDLYFVLTVSELFLTPSSMLKGVLLGVGGTLFAVLVPASEAAFSPPRSVLARSRAESGAKRLVLPLAWAGGRVPLWRYCCCCRAGVWCLVLLRCLP